MDEAMENPFFAMCITPIFVINIAVPLRFAAQLQGALIKTEQV